MILQVNPTELAEVPGPCWLKPFQEFGNHLSKRDASLKEGRKEGL